jgi:tRNA G37 N-methylase Trm5
MGYLFRPERFIPTALRTLNEKGTLHYHFLSSMSKLNKERESVVKSIKKMGYHTKILKTVRVKSYSPKRYHWVLDIATAK